MNENLSRRGVLAAAATATAIALTPATVAQARTGSPGETFELTEATDQIVPFRVAVPGSALADLRRRLLATRLPNHQTGATWQQGAPLEQVEDLLRYWRDRYDWRTFERRVNKYPQFRTRLDGLGVHFIHVRSRHEEALPLVLTHGWPGSFIEFLDVIEVLTNPTRHGGSAADAFHVVIPSLPGFGFSDKPTEPGWGLPRIARAWDTLMKRLGYERYIAQGGDWGAGVTTWMGKQRPEGLAGVHVNLPLLFGPPPLIATKTPEEETALKSLAAFGTNETGYSLLQRTRPQTLGYGLADSPSGQAAWIYEKLALWSDSNRRPDVLFGRDKMLDNISLYWLTNTAASSARLYAESYQNDFVTIELDLPVGVSMFPHENTVMPRIWGERVYKNLVYWNDRIPHGGHFAAFEQPALFATELKNFARTIR